MGESTTDARNLYRRRIDKERGVTEAEVVARMRWDMPVLSSNPKCSISLDLPLSGCQPSSICSQVCYAAQGRQLYRRAVIKALAIDQLIEFDAEHVARKMVDEAAGRNTRVAGSGEVLPKHAGLLSWVDRLGGKWWGMTRRVDTHQVLPSLMFSIDASTPPAIMDYVRDYVPVDRRCYLRRPNDDACSLEVAVTFPVHGPWTNYSDNVPRHETDCPVDREEMKGCWSCRRCY